MWCATSPTYDSIVQHNVRLTQTRKQNSIDNEERSIVHHGRVYYQIPRFGIYYRNPKEEELETTRANMDEYLLQNAGVRRRRGRIWRRRQQRLS